MDMLQPAQKGHASSNVPNALLVFPADFYLVGLFGFCNGTYDGKDSTVTSCIPPRVSFRFDVPEVLGSELSPHGLLNNLAGRGIWYYQKYMPWASASYVASFSLIVVALLAGLSTTRSPLSNVLASIFALAAMMSTFSGSLTAISTSAILVESLRLSSHQCGTEATLGWIMTIISIVATGSVIMSGSLWLLNTCCFSVEQTAQLNPTNADRAESSQLAPLSALKG